VDLVQDLGLVGIIFMMFLESSFFPFPSEVAIIPAGYLAQKGQMNLVLVILAGTFGSLLGAIFNYYLAFFLGRKFIIKYGKYVFFTEEKMTKVEKFFIAHGSISTFSTRLIPVFRQYISFPAGLAKMPFGKFCFFTSLGAGIWVSVLAFLGYYFGENEDLIKKYLHLILFGFGIFLALILAIYTKKKKKANK